MHYFGDFASQLNQIIFPNPEQGYTATVREYKDEVGKIIKVAVDIMASCRHGRSRACGWRDNCCCGRWRESRSRGIRLPYHSGIEGKNSGGSRKSGG